MAGSLDFRRLFESSRGAYLVLDPELRIVAVTDAYLAATSTEREAILGREVFEAIPGYPPDSETTGALRSSLETVLRSGARHTMPVQKYETARSEEGGELEQRHWRPVNAPVVAGEKVAYIIHALEDVTDLVRLEKLRGENRETTSQLTSLRDADHAKDEFIAIISHELRTPMTSILGWARMLSLGGLDETTRLEALEAIERSTLAQARLIEDLLDESRIASGRLRLDPRAVDLRAIVASAVSMVRPAAEAKSITLVLDSGEVPREVFADPARLQQAVGNLLGNAIKFTPEGGRVSVNVGVDDDAATIEVTDTGRGISPELLPQVFERFRQGEGQAVERQSGLGLGLSITRHLVELHGGSVVAASEGEQRGSTFTIRLPLHESAAGSRAVVGRDAAARLRALPRLEDVRVLIVEDEIDNRKVLAAALRHCGATVQCASTAAEAFELVPAWRPDAIVCDIALPDLDGCTFLTELRSREGAAVEATPALALTVLGRPGEQARITAAGFEVFRQKPIDPVDLAHEIARLTRDRSAASSTAE
jgi:signal transduction histidine kinase/CheY-like chemotaxis protein